MRLLSGSVGSGTAWIQQAVSVVIIIVGVYQIIDGNLSQGGLIAAYMLSSRIMAPVGQTAGLLMQYHSAATALTALEQIMEKPVERPLDKQWISRPAYKVESSLKKSRFSIHRMSVKSCAMYLSKLILASELPCWGVMARVKPPWKN
ncbi:hypothetical protein [Cellvibrio sp. KY-GH-1]|uniref:hypothetical protein n=1 Tax=Cellvibrio sp. KY-GH-1 TaxID=2303332 RepID=UPI00351A83F0